MHEIQERLLEISSKVNLSGLSLREIGELIGISHPQRVKHHLDQLAKKGLVHVGNAKAAVKKTKKWSKSEDGLIAVPIVGAANCGPAELFADQNIEGYLRISSRILMKKNEVFIIKAVGSSMNRASVNGERIEDGDYVVVDATIKHPNNGDYVVSVIDDVANIKRFYKDPKHHQIMLLSESTTPYPPIYIHQDDMESYVVAGRVVQVIKKPQIPKYS